MPAMFTRQRISLLLASMFLSLGALSCSHRSDEARRAENLGQSGRGIQKYKYQCWEGGPHIVLPRSLQGVWKGHQLAFNPLDPSTDYGRACAVSGDFGLIPVGTGRALVLAQSPPMVAWSPLSSADEIDLFILKSWSDQNLDSLIDKTIESALLQPTGDTWQIQDDQLGMYFAGDDPQQPIAGEILIACRNGAYSLWSCTHTEPGAGEVVMIRLVRSGKSK